MEQAPQSFLQLAKIILDTFQSKYLPNTKIKHLCGVAIEKTGNNRPEILAETLSAIDTEKGILE